MLGFIIAIAVSLFLLVLTWRSASALNGLNYLVMRMYEPVTGRTYFCVDDVIKIGDTVTRSSIVQGPSRAELYASFANLQRR